MPIASFCLPTKVVPILGMLSLETLCTLTSSASRSRQQPRVSYVGFSQYFALVISALIKVRVKRKCHGSRGTELDETARVLEECNASRPHALLPHLLHVAEQVAELDRDAFAHIQV